MSSVSGTSGALFQLAASGSAVVTGLGVGVSAIGIGGEVWLVVVLVGRSGLLAV